MADGLTTEQLDAMEHGGLTDEQLNALESAPSQPQQWESVRGNKPADSLLSWLNPWKGMSEDKIPATVDAMRKAQGFTTSLVGAATGDEGPDSQATKLAASVIDPLAGGASAFSQGLGAVPFGSQIGSAIGKASEFLAPKVASLISNNPESVMNPADTASTRANVESGIQAALVNNSATVAALAAPEVAKGVKLARGEVPVRAPGEPAGVPANAAVDLLQKQLKPGKNTEIASDFEKEAPAALNDIVQQAPNVEKGKSSTPNHDRFIEMADQAKRPFGEQMGAMIDEGMKRGEYYDPKNLWAKLDEAVNKPLVQLFSPEFLNKIDELKQRFPDRMPLDVAHQLASDISAQLRKMDNAIGPAEDVIGQNAKYNTMKTLELDIRDQLNEKLSPTTDAWRNASQRYGAISRLQDLAQAAKNSVRSGSDATVGQLIDEAGKDALIGGLGGSAIGGPHGAVAGVVGGALYPLAKRLVSRGAADRAIGKVIKLAERNPAEVPAQGVASPQPTTLASGASTIRKPILTPTMLAQFPSLQDQPITGAEAPQSNLQTYRQPESVNLPRPEPSPAPQPVAIARPPIPDFASLILKSAYSPLDLYKDSQMMQKIINGKSKVSYAEAIKNRDMWADPQKAIPLLKNLATDPNAANTINELVKVAGKKVNPF